MKVIKFSDKKYLPASHEDLNNPGVFKKVLLTFKDLSKGRIQMVNWAKLPPGRSFRPHYHQDMQEIFIILSGIVKLTIDNESVMLHKRDTVIINVGAVHKMTNTGRIAAEYLAIGITEKGNGKTIVTN